MASRFQKVTEWRSSKLIFARGNNIDLQFLLSSEPFILLSYSSIGQTHALDPAVELPDGSHMDVAKGFKPERWLNEATKPTEYLPFGYGPRFCLGYNLAMAEMKVFLALFARRVDFDLVNMSSDHVTWKKASIIPKPEDGAVISVKSLV
jgi:hypothetical protein